MTLFFQNHQSIPSRLPGETALLPRQDAPKSSHLGSVQNNHSGENLVSFSPLSMIACAIVAEDHSILSGDWAEAPPAIGGAAKPKH